ncbi:MAG: hypothetical protein U0R71_14205 [Solirubrobacterales bacterium]
MQRREHRSRALLGAALLALLLGGLLPAAAGAATTPFHRDLRAIEAKLRDAIEFEPVEMTEHLTAAEDVCEVGEGAQGRGDAAGAEADWSTLAQLVAVLGEPSARRVDTALARADSALRRLGDKYAAYWPDAGRRRALRAGVKDARAGLAAVRRAVATIGGSFAAWRAHDCAAATSAIESGVSLVPGAIAPINRGMARLWALP